MEKERMEGSTSKQPAKARSVRSKITISERLDRLEDLWKSYVKKTDKQLQALTKSIQSLELMLEIAFNSPQMDLIFQRSSPPPKAESSSEVESFPQPIPRRKKTAVSKRRIPLSPSHIKEAEAFLKRHKGEGTSNARSLEVQMKEARKEQPAKENQEEKSVEQKDKEKSFESKLQQKTVLKKQPPHQQKTQLEEDSVKIPEEIKGNEEEISLLKRPSEEELKDKGKGLAEPEKLPEVTTMNKHPTPLQFSGFARCELCKHYHRFGQCRLPGTCFKCGQVGHQAKGCLNDVACYACGIFGHRIKNCPLRLFNKDK